MTPTTEFLPRLLPYLSGCPSSAAEQALVDAATSFCEDSLAIRQRLDTELTSNGNPEFDITAPPNQLVTRVLKVWVDGREIGSMPAESVDDQRFVSSFPRAFYTLLDDSGLTALLYPVPDNSYTLIAEVALKPIRGARSLHTDLFNTWIDIILDGAKARLMSIPDQPYTNLSAAQNYLLMARVGARKARIEASLGRIRGTVRARPRPFV